MRITEPRVETPIDGAPGVRTSRLIAALATPRLAFVIFLGVYLLTWPGHYTTGDGAIKIAWARAMLERGSADIDPGPDVAYSKYGIGHSLIAIVPLAAGRVIRQLTGVNVEAALYTLVFVLNGALLIALVAAYLRPRFGAPATAATVSLIGLATMWWPYTKLDFTEPLTLTALFGGFLLLRKDRIVSGALLTSVAGLLKLESAVLVVLVFAWHVAVRRRRHDLFLLAAGALPALVVHFIAAAVRAGAADSGYDGEQFSTPVLQGIHGLLFSGGRSVFLFNPPLVAGVVGLRRFAASRQGREDAILFALIFLTQLALYSGWWDWSGDDCWGPRFLLPGAVLLTIPAVSALGHRTLVAGLGACGLFVQLLGVLVSPLNYVLLVREARPERVALFTGERVPVDFEDVRYNPRYSQLAGHWILVRYAVGAPPSVSRPDDEARSGTPIHETVPPDVWRRFGRFDIIWLQLPRLVAAVVSSDTSEPPPVSGDSTESSSSVRESAVENGDDVGTNGSRVDR